MTNNFKKNIHGATQSKIISSAWKSNVGQTNGHILKKMLEWQSLQCTELFKQETVFNIVEKGHYLVEKSFYLVIMKHIV